MPTNREQMAVSCRIWLDSTMLVNGRTDSLIIVAMEAVAKKRLDKNAGIQNDFPTFRCRMFFIVFQLSTLRRAATEASAMFEVIISQFIHIPRVVFIKI